MLYRKCQPVLSILWYCFKKIVRGLTYMRLTGDLFFLKEWIISSNCLHKEFSRSEVNATSYSLTPELDSSLPLRLTSSTEDFTSAYHVKLEGKSLQCVQHPPSFVQCLSQHYHHVLLSLHQSLQYSWLYSVTFCLARGSRIKSVLV